MTAQVTWTFNGSAVARTTSLGAVWTLDPATGYRFDLDPATLAERDHKYIAVHDAMVDQGSARINPVRNWSLTLLCSVSGMAGSDVTAKLADAWGELQAAFPISGGVVKLQSARADITGATITRFLLVEVTEEPTFALRSGEPAGLAESGAYTGGTGYIVYKVRGRTVFPYWVGSALLTLDGSAAAAELAIGASPDTVTIVNAGRRWTGVRLRVKTGSVSGSVTSITFSNGANSDELIWTNAGGFADGDYLDWFATDPRTIDRTDTANRFGGTSTRMRLDVGSNTLTGTRSAGTGTLTVELLWPALFLTN